MLDFSQYFPITDPTLIFFVVLCVILLAPIVMGKLRIPHIIGMVLAGVFLGEYGLNILKRDDSFELFGKVGLYYIMFLAGLEMNLEGIKKQKSHFVFFGLLTFAIPFVLTYFMGTLLFDYPAVKSLLLSCIMSANTLIAYPIVGRYGLQRHRSVSLSVGSSMIALLLSLIILAALIGTSQGTSGWLFWLLFLLKFALFCGGMVYLLPRLARWFLRRYSDSVMQFIFILSLLFFTAACSEMIGLEGIFGAFFSGLVLNRYIPRLSALMNRIEFIGNALFIPYFLIGVGMLINIRLLFEGGAILYFVVLIIFFGTLGKALAAYVSSSAFAMSRLSGHMMFGLTSAHAAGAIAMAMVGLRLESAPGVPLINDEILNGLVVMILFTCIISSMVTERAAQQIVLEDRQFVQDSEPNNDDEKILIPVKYPEYAERLLQLAMMMRNPKLNRGIVGLNVVYDDIEALRHQEEGRKLLEMITKQATACDVRIETQVRIAANIANGIKHAFKEFNASEILMGLHVHKNISGKFWGEFTQSLYNGLRRQIIIVRCMQPLNTLRRVQVAVPSRAEYEPGFNRWLERLLRLAGNLDCRIQFHGRDESLQLIKEYVRNRHPEVRADFTLMAHWKEMPQLASTISEDHLFVVVTARKGSVSYKTALDYLPDELTRHFMGKNIMIIYPDQHGDPMESLTFAESQHQEETSAYHVVKEWVRKHKM